MEKINVSNIMQAHNEAGITVLRSVLLENSDSVLLFVRTMRLFHEQHGCRALIIKPHKLESELQFVPEPDEYKDADTVDWLPNLYAGLLSIVDLIEVLRPELVRYGVDCSVATDLNYDSYLVFSKGDPQYTQPT